MFNLGQIFISCLAFVTFASAQKFPTDIDRCFYKDERCLANVVQNILNKHSQGHKGLNIIPLDPLHITSVNFKKIPGSAVSIDLKLTDADLTGLSRGTVTKVAGFEKDPVDLDIDLEVKVPKIVLTGMYEMDGEIEKLPIRGKGKCTITFDNLIIVAQLKSSTTTKDNKKYLNIERVIVDLKPKNVRYDFGNLFDGDEILGGKMNDFLNQNWSLAYGGLKPLIDESLAKIVLHTASGPFSKLPYSDLFLPF